MDFKNWLNIAETEQPEQRPQIDYPCPWEYTAIGTDEDEVRKAIAHVMGEHPHNVAYKRKLGKYHSLSMDTHVDSEEHRNAIFSKLKSHPHIKMVM